METKIHFRCPNCGVVDQDHVTYNEDRTDTWVHYIEELHEGTLMISNPEVDERSGETLNSYFECITCQRTVTPLFEYFETWID